MFLGDTPYESKYSNTLSSLINNVQCPELFSDSVKIKQKSILFGNNS